VRYRALDQNGDFSFGAGSANYLVNSPAAVAQAITTRLRLWQGEWFLDDTEGTPYAQEILGYGPQPLRDLAIQERILGTPGVTEILSYQSSLSPGNRPPPGRGLKVQVSVLTAFSAAPVQINEVL
jgi:hypothetical protein